MQTPKASKSGSSEVTQRVSPRSVRQLKPTSIETEAASFPNQASRTVKDRSPKVVERRSPRSPVAEKKRPSRISELELQISLLQEELKKTKDQLTSSETTEKQAQQDLEESKKERCAISSQLEESQKQLKACEQARLVEFQKISKGQDHIWQSELQYVQGQHIFSSVSLASAMSEIEQLKVQLEMVSKCEAAQLMQAEFTQREVQSVQQNLVETIVLVANMNNQLKNSKESETQAPSLATQTLLLLETAKKSVEALRLEGMKAIESYSSISSEIDQSRAHATSLEEIIGGLKLDLHGGDSNCSLDSDNNINIEQEAVESNKSEELKRREAEISSLKFEVEQLRSALETAEIKYHEEQKQSTLQIKSAHDLVEQIKSGSSLRESELLEELKMARFDIEELRAIIMDKETELQGISEENEVLLKRLEKNLSQQREREMEKEIRRLMEAITDLKANMMDKETELQNIVEENEILRLKINKSEVENGKEKHIAELEVAKAAEQEALMKLGLAMEEVDKSNKRVTRIAEQLEAAQTASSEMEAELRRLKVQSDQWRKAAEAAASMLSAGNNGKFMERTGSLDSAYNSATGKNCSPYSEDMDDDLLRKRNGNMLKRIGVLWKKPQK